MEIIFWWILCKFWSMNNTIFEFYTTPPPPLCPNSPRSNREGAVSGRISTAKGPKVICDLTFWVYFTISALSQKSIIELRNTLSKIDSQDTAPGILKFWDLLNFKFLSNSPSKRQGHIWPGQWEIGLIVTEKIRWCWYDEIALPPPS